MTTNIIKFKSLPLVQFCQYHLNRKDRIAKYLSGWVRLYAEKPPKNYIPKATTNLCPNEFIISFGGKLEYIGNFYLSFEKIVELENIVENIFNATIFTQLFSKMWKQKIENIIEDICNQYKIDINNIDTIKKRFYRIRTELNVRK